MHCKVNQDFTHLSHFFTSLSERSYHSAKLWLFQKIGQIRTVRFDAHMFELFWDILNTNKEPMSLSSALSNGKNNVISKRKRKYQDENPKIIDLNLESDQESNDVEILDVKVKKVTRRLRI